MTGNLDVPEAPEAAAPAGLRAVDLVKAGVLNRTFMTAVAAVFLAYIAAAGFNWFTVLLAACLLLSVGVTVLTVVTLVKNPTYARSTRWIVRPTLKPVTTPPVAVSDTKIVIGAARWEIVPSTLAVLLLGAGLLVGIQPLLALGLMVFGAELANWTVLVMAFRELAAAASD